MKTKSKKIFNPALNNGLYIRSETGVDPEVKGQCIDFINWLRKKMSFPIRIIIYLKKDYYIQTRYTKEYVSAIFWGPYDKKEKPNIKVATGDYYELQIKYGKFNALKAILGSISHEIIHYQQWLNNQKANEKKAKQKSKEIVFNYIEYETYKFCQKIETLKNTQTINSLNNLLELFDKGSPEVKLNIIESLTFFPNYEKAKEFLIKLTTKSDPEIQCKALRTLSFFKGEDVNQTVINCLKDSNKEIRIEAAQTLKDVGNEKTIAPLIDSLSDDNELVRGYAAVSLGVIGDEKIITLLKEKLKQEKRNATRLRIYVGLYYLGEKDCFNLILEQLKSRSYLVRLATTYYLADIADKKNIELIIKKLKIALKNEKRKEIHKLIRVTLEKLKIEF